MASCVISSDNYGKVIDDSDKIIQLNPTFTKSFYRKAQAQFALGKFVECTETCSAGLKIESEESLEKLRNFATEKYEQFLQKSNLKKQEFDKVQLELKTRLEKHGISYSPKFSADIQREYHPKFGINSGQIMTSVTVFYPEFQQLDLIESAFENDTLYNHISSVLEEGLPWDLQRLYLDEDNVRIFLMVEKRETVADSQSPKISQSLVEIPKNQTVLQTLQTKNYIVPGNLEVYVVSTKSSFFSHFLSLYL